MLLQCSLTDVDDVMIDVDYVYETEESAITNVKKVCDEVCKRLCSQIIKYYQ